MIQSVQSYSTPIEYKQMHGQMAAAICAPPGRDN